MATATAKKSRKSAVKVNRSAKVREFLQAQPDATAKEVIEHLAKENLTVTEALISNIRSRLKAGPKKNRRSKKFGKGESVNVNDLLLVKDFAEKMGGLPRTQSAIDTLVKLFG